MSLRLIEKLERVWATLLVAAGLTCVAPAQAAIFQGAWDPTFGSAFPDLGWRGEAKFFVPDACLAEEGWVSNSESCSNFGMKIFNAEIEFYRVSDPTHPTLETLLFGESSMVAAMRIEDGLLTGLFATYFPQFVLSTLPLAGGYTKFTLSFLDDLALLCSKTFACSTLNPPEGPPRITFQLVPEPDSLALALLALASLMTSRRRAR